MALDWDSVLSGDTFKMSNQRRPIVSTAPYGQSITRPLAMTQPLFSHQQELSDISPSSESLPADDLLPEEYFLTDDQFLNDWNFFDPMKTQGNDRMAVAMAPPAKMQHIQIPTTLDPSELSALTVTSDSMRAAMAGEPLIVGSVETTKAAFPLMSKRNKVPSDTRAACWESPLCPNHNKEGTPPNPSTCGGACAPFLFDFPDTTLDDQPITSIESPPSPVQEQENEIDVTKAVPLRPQAQRTNSTTSITSTPASANRRNSRQSTTSTQNTLKHQMKRESPLDEESAGEEDPSPLPTTGPAPKGRPRGRVPHNQVERKYRESLNTQLESLRKVVPELSRPAQICEGADIEDLPTPSKPSKAVILASATSYIKQMEKEKKAVAEENRQLKIRLKALQSLVKCDDCGLMQYVMDLKINGPK